DCTQYSRERSFDEGFNELTFRAKDRANNEAYFTVSFSIDSKDPKVRSLQPDKGFASGTFSVSFDEDNPDELILHYGNFDTGYRDHAFNLAADCAPSTSDTECTTHVNLADYEGQQIEAYVTLTDLASNMDETNHVNLDVDNNPPIINSLDYAIQGKKATFTLNINEPYFSKAIYIDYSESNPREKNLCSRLVNDICEDTVSFNKEGIHDVTIIVRDKAGNEATQQVSFFTDSKKPKIRDILPDSGFASGIFEIEFEESNPESLTLEYGNLQTGFRTHEFNLANCLADQDNYFCSEQVNLADYDSQKIKYTFTLTDSASQSVAKSQENLAVDISYPIINSLNYTIEGKNVYFIIYIQESYLDEVTYIDNSESRPKEKRLCNKLVNGVCEKKIPFNKDGNHDVTITVKDKAGHVSAQSIQFFTDSKKPKITMVSPDDGFASGIFEVEFQEENPTHVFLSYGNSDMGYPTIELSLADECTHDEDEYYCSKQLDLSAHEGQKIEYLFTVIDRAYQGDFAEEKNLLVDTTSPIVNSINYEASGNKADVILSVTEQNLDKITYMNLDELRPRERIFCSKLNSDSECKKRITLQPGTNRIQFSVLDKAGNLIVQQATIEN
ncbi:MAG: hypothetical protein KKE05_00265, partial [Nanoarchaeota archaeon]|nr:hypothetical protein [Nanoarchaeota archaeon]